MARTAKNILYALTIYFCQVTAYAQQNKIDSLLSLLKTDKFDTNKVNHLNNIAKELSFNNPDTSMLLGKQALQIAKKLNWKKGIASSYNSIGNVYDNQDNYRNALKNHFAALKIQSEISDKNGISTSYNNLGNVYYGQGNYPEALKNYFASLKIKEELGDKKGISISHNNIGNIYSIQRNYPEALKNHFASLKIKEELGDKKGISNSHNNIGIVYSYQGNYPEALKNYFASLKINNELGNKVGISNSYNNIGGIYEYQGNYPEALKNYFASLKIDEELGNKYGIAMSYGNISALAMQQKQYSRAAIYLQKALELSLTLGTKDITKDIYSRLTDLNSATNNFKGAYENHKMYILYRDSIDNEETKKKTIQSQMTYDFEKKEAATKAEQDKKDIIIKAELKQKEQQRNYFIVGFALLGLLSLFIFRGYKQKQKANIIITQQKEEVEKSKHIIEEKNKDITDSINYAKRIQHAMLPQSRDISAAFPSSFVLFKPKDIVSGDFYFFHKNNQNNFIATADCTGHGVPGAFMSMIGAGKLNEAVSQTENTSAILSLLNKGIHTALKQTDSNESTRDGMDIALCAINTEDRIVKYAGAHRPLWIIRKGATALEEIKATKSAIGGLTEDNQHFETHEIKLLLGDTIYISTDGFADQFSGMHGKKLMAKKFKEILLSIQDKTMTEQKEFLDNFIENWRAGTEQVDDILVIGLRL